MSLAPFPGLEANKKKKQPYMQLEKSTIQSGLTMMSANLVVIAFVRIIQIILACVIFYKAYTLKVTSSVEVFCPGNTEPSIKYDVQYPFDYVHVPSKSDCSQASIPVTDSFATGFAPTAYLFTLSVAVSIAYGVAAIIFYCLKHQAYDVQKKLPALDLLMSLAVGIMWAICAYMAWSNYPDLKNNTSGDQIQMKATLCKDTNAYCSSYNGGNWEDMNSYLFLGIANILSWGISVWFIFMETGLYPDEYEYGDDLVDYEGGFTQGPPTFVAFPEMAQKAAMAAGAGGGGGGNLVGSAGLNDGHLVEYWKNYRKQANLGDDGDRFANGYTFTPIVPSVSEAVQDKDDPNPVKVHNKWNLFQA
ncbi:Synaptophysin [Halotydeus destructor]|nr:Synaptophysin [Halotydeus destructor]